ncbi:DUF4836 family protein [Sphingobacterium paludis]|uniref:DUF4836 family protein n=1 Tax=Sphingobacterium paludis TaxID=1476465 RepID=A0A4R7DCD7_9SPHI|nr:hypothetical protein [Sphingobacterium paludis]TDS17584.1 hypothetical protein B0I21_101451 [Sphingobacterium paludis]
MIALKKYLIGLLGLGFSSLTYGQDLMQRIPSQADMVAVLNNQAIVKHSSLEKLNEVLTTLGAFDALQDGQQRRVNTLEDVDLDYDRNAYVYRTNTDSAYYVGILIPLKAGHEIEKSMFSELTPSTLPTGLRQATAKDGKTQLAWDNNSLLILTGNYKSHYFRNDSVAAAYGIELPAYANNLYDSVATAFDPAIDGMGDFGTKIPDTLIDSIGDLAYSLADGDTLAAADTAMQITTETSYDSIAPPADWDDYAYADTAVAYDDYYDTQYDSYNDDSYQEEMIRNAKNDSIKNSLFQVWITTEVEQHLHLTKASIVHKQIGKYDRNNTLLHVWVKDLNEVYRDALPYGDLSGGFGINMQNLNYGYQDAVLDLVQEKNVLKVKGSVGLDKDIRQLFAKMYTSKANRKFAKYIPEKHLGYLSLNVSTEAYLNGIPKLFERWYAPVLPSYEDLINIAGVGIQIALDEKAIAKVMRGDHIVFINDLKKVTTDYIDYEYDEEYNYKEVKKTKEEEIPNFLWMFTSEDQRIYKRLLLFAEKKNQASQSEGVFRISEHEKSMPIYIFFKDDLVFVGNDEEQLVAIKNNQFKTSKDASVKKQIFANNMTATVHTAQLPEVINKLGIPIMGNGTKTVASLADYGDISIRANGLKKNRLEGEISVAFPQKENNALQYLLQSIIDTPPLN